ncbi:MAG: methyltransferase [Deltaproteobacteria bacterium]|nr:methyltransferase [Deltaproteobacteria bacterium]
MTDNNNSPSGPTAQETLMQMIMGGTVTQFVGTAVKLGIPDVLNDARMSAEEVARQCSTREEETYRFLRGLSAIGVVNEHDERHFSLTPVGKWLRSDIPGSFKPMAMMHSGLWSGQVFANLAHTIKTGESAFGKTFGCGLFEWLSRDPKMVELFGQGMSTFSSMEIALVVDGYDFSGVDCIVDVGGSHGDLLSAILANTKDVRGILFDTPDTIKAAKSYLTMDMAERITLTSGDFFESVPKGGDIYLLKHVLHDWDNEKASAIMQNVAEAMKKGGRVLVIEQGITPPGVFGPGKMMDVSMMALTDGGMERTPEQHKQIFESAGLEFVRTIHTSGSISIFEAIRP